MIRSVWFVLLVMELVLLCGSVCSVVVKVVSVAIY